MIVFDILSNLYFIFIAKYGSCYIERTARGEKSAGKPFYQQRPQITSSCVANDNCNYSVHVITTSGANGTGYYTKPAPVITVSISMSGDEEDTRPMILFLSSYYAVHWSLSIPQGVVFERVILV